jgi:WD repeat-containing protein 21A
MFIMSPPESIYDIWTASLAGRSLVFGAHKEAVYVPDLGANSGAFVRLRTHSDVLAVAQAPHLAYAGARSGAITRFDLRAPREAGARLFAQHAEGTGAPAVTGLRVLREFELVVARIDGQLCTHDLRFATLDSSQPITTLSGHVNGYATHTVRRHCVMKCANRSSAILRNTAARQRPIRRHPLRGRDGQLHPRVVTS